MYKRQVEIPAARTRGIRLLIRVANTGVAKAVGIEKSWKSPAIRLAVLVAIPLAIAIDGSQATIV